MYEIWVHTPDYSQRTAIICEAGQDREGWIFSSLKIPRKENQVTEAVITMPYQAGIIELFPLDTQLEFYENGMLQLETQWFVRVPPKLTYADDGALLVEIRAECALYLLSGRIVAYAAGSPQSVKSGPADNVIKSIVRENLGSLATAADRNLSVYLDIVADTSQGAMVHKTVTRRNVLLVCQEIARSSAQAGTPIFFDVVWTGSRLEFRTYAGQRGHVRSTVLAASFGTLSQVSRSFDHRDEATVIYCAGQGRGGDRVIVSVSDDARRTMTPFNRREVYVDARYLSLTESIATEADATLWRRRPVQGLGGVAIDTSSVVYGYTWGWGDLLLSEDKGESFPARVYGLTIEVTPGVPFGSAQGSRRILVELRADSTEADDAVRRIEGRLDQDAPNELPIFSVEPLGDAVPVAASDGFIDIGWLNPADLPDPVASWDAVTGKPTAFLPEAHASTHTTSGSDSLAPEDIGAAPGTHAAQHKHDGGDEIAVAAPAANAIPKAQADGTVQDGWLSAAIARLAQLAWANIAGKPSTFAPSAHAGSHGSGGSDAVSPAAIGASAMGHAHSKANITDLETITATPTASAVPKAGADGTLADGWMSATIARVSQLAWTNITGKPSTFTPSAHAHAGEDVTTGTVADARIAGSIARLSQLTWGNIGGKPSTFPPSAHTHLWAEISDHPVAFYPQTTPLTSANWNTQAKSTGTWTINMNTEFGVPSGARAVAIRVSASWSAVGGNITIRPWQASTGVMALRAQAANVIIDGVGIIALNSNAIDFVIFTAATTYTFISVSGYWI